ncbi:hypothetical protein D3C84_926370 [compost metagenome]
MPQHRCRRLRSVRSASQPSGTWQTMSPSRITVTMKAAMPTPKPWALAYTGNSDSTTASKKAKNSTPVQSAGATRRKPAREKVRASSSAACAQSSGRLCQISARADRLARVTIITSHGPWVPIRPISAGPPNWQPVKQAA